MKAPQTRGAFLCPWPPTNPRFVKPPDSIATLYEAPVFKSAPGPGAANAFYDRAVSEHLMIGLAALDRMRGELSQLHSRKLRSFDEPPFR